MDRETLIGAIEQRKRIAERNNQAFVDLPYEIVGEVLELLKEQDAEIRQLRLALDIAKGTCKGIKSGGGQFADMPTMQSAT